MENQAYISRVHLKGYKSIRDMEIDFKAGLNIIIGPNGSGKTNFLEFAKKGLDREFLELNGNFSFSFEFKNISVSKWAAKSEFKRSNKNNFIEESSIEEGVENSQKLPYSTNINNQIPNHFAPLSSYDKINLMRPFCKINYSVPSNIPLLDTPYSTDGDKMFQFPQFSSFAHFFDSHLGYIGNSLHGYSQKVIDEYIPGFFILDKEILESLKTYSPIKDVQLSKGYRYFSDSPDHFFLDFLSFEFLVNGKWLNWTQLSDGTRRLFYLIHEVSYYKKGVFFIEEPELGIHPHQLSRLMDFLKAQSKEKQIIITTHSPQVLNELKEDELDRIIVTRHEGERGTQMYHLSEEEKGFAKGYMQDGAFLSDYWVQSGFMNEEEIV